MRGYGCAASTSSTAATLHVSQYWVYTCEIMGRRAEACVGLSYRHRQLSSCSLDRQLRDRNPARRRSIQSSSFPAHLRTSVDGIANGEASSVRGRMGCSIASLSTSLLAPRSTSPGGLLLMCEIQSPASIRQARTHQTAPSPLRTGTSLAYTPTDSPRSSSSNASAESHTDSAR